MKAGYMLWRKPPIEFASPSLPHSHLVSPIRIVYFPDINSQFERMGGPESLRVLKVEGHGSSLQVDKAARAAGATPLDQSSAQRSNLRIIHTRR